MLCVENYILLKRILRLKKSFPLPLRRREMISNSGTFLPDQQGGRSPPLRFYLTAIITGR